MVASAQTCPFCIGTPPPLFSSPKLRPLETLIILNIFSLWSYFQIFHTKRSLKCNGFLDQGGDIFEYRREVMTFHFVDLKQIHSQMFLQQNGFIWELQRIAIQNMQSNGKPLRVQIKEGIALLWSWEGLL